MNTRMAALRIVLLMISLGGLAPVARGGTISYTDGFEGVSFNPFWTIGQQNGAVTLSTNQPHSGTQSAEFASTDGNRLLTLTHAFSTLMTGTASVWFYDGAAGQQTLYEQLRLYNASQNSLGLAVVGTQDFDAFCYTAFVETSSGNMGPNANCGQFPQQSTTNVSRTLGWHLLSINMGTNSTSLAIDGGQVFSILGPYTFDTVQILVQGPAFRPNTVAYFDDFSITASTPAPEPGTLALFLPALLFGGVMRYVCVRRTKPRFQ